MNSELGVAVVTGGSRGIGAATAMLIAARGWDIAVGLQGDLDIADRVAASCRATGSRAIVGAG